MADVELALALAAAVAFAVAATLWQRASIAAGVEPGDTAKMLELLLNPVWLVGLVAQIIGVVLQAAALHDGRVAIVQPVLVTSIVWALPLGYYLTNQSINRIHVLGAAVTVLGLAVFGQVGDPAIGVDDAPLTEWLIALAVLLAICVGLLLLDARRSMRTTAALVGTAAGILYGIGATLLKPVVEVLRDDGVVAAIGDWELYVMAAAGLAGFYLQQVSLATGRLVTSVATVAVVNPVVSVGLGALVLQERLDVDPAWHRTVAILGLVGALAGATLIAWASYAPLDSSRRG